jgi:quercetin dioxygenase-like cupin family protein
MTTAPKAEILKLAQMAAYQEGSVVSRQITKAEAGNITLFAFDTGQELSEHISPFDALVQVLDGAAEILISGQPFQITTGQSIILPAGQAHAIKATQKFKMLLTMIRA